MKDIKKRLKDAYENVEFYASNIWTHSFNSYQRINQELFVRESKLRDSFFDELTRPRTIRDSIPNSKLAQYANYEYNESRELSYASSAGNISFYYPCVYKRKSNKEPWMLPEIEQLFIWMSYPPKFDILEALKLEDLNHLDDQNQFRYNSSYIHRNDFHEISPVFYDTFERTPGKSRYKSCPILTEDDFEKYSPTILKIETFEDMILRMKIKSEKVRYLWSKKLIPKLEIIKEKNVNVYKTLLGNYFYLKENDFKRKQREEDLQYNSFSTLDFSLRKNDCSNLQKLYAAIQSLENFFLNITSQLKEEVAEEKKKEVIKIENKTKVESTPTRRLYSAVLQGLPTDTKVSASTEESPSSNSPTQDIVSSPVMNTTPVKKSSTLSTTNNSSLTALTPVYKSTPVLSNSVFPSLSPSSNWFTSSSSWSTSQSKSFNQVQQESFNKPTNFEFNYTSSFSVAQKIDTFKSSSNIFTFPVCDAAYMDPSLNIPIRNINSSTSTTSSFLNYSTDYLENACSNQNISNSSSNTDSNSSNACFSSLYGTNSFYNYTCLNSQVIPNRQTNSFTELSVSNSNQLYTNNLYNIPNQASVINSQNIYPQYCRQPYHSLSPPPPPPPPPLPPPPQSTNQIHMSTPQSMWVMQQNRHPSNVYSLTQFGGQPFLYLPQAQPTQQPIMQSQRQNQRWTSHSTHYIRTPNTLQSYPYSMTPHNSSSSPSQPWGLTNQNLYHANSNHHISRTSQHYIEQQTGMNLQNDSNENRSHMMTQPGFLQQNTRTSSTDYWMSGNYDIRDIYCDTYTREFSKQSTCSSDIAFSLSPSEKSSNVKHVASTPSLDFRRTKTYNNYNDLKRRPSPTNSFDHRENSYYYETHMKEECKLVPIIDPFADELERQALEQYQPSNENFYQELERQAKEQYDEDHSENLMSPPYKLILFGGLLLNFRNLLRFLFNC